MLSEKLAQKIVDKIMNSIDYNINVMDKDGRIIASGDSSRIGDIHQGAVRAIKEEKSYTIYQDTKTEKKGINDPIFIDDECVGVVGISGEPEEIIKIKKVVNSLFYFLISHEMEMSQQFSEIERRQKFIRKLLYNTEPISTDDIEYAHRHQFNIDAEMYVIDVKGELKATVDNLFLHDKGDGEVVILLPVETLANSKNALEKKVKSLFKEGYKCGVSKIKKNVHLGYRQARAVLRWMNIMESDREISYYAEEALFVNVLLYRTDLLETAPTNKFSRNNYSILYDTFLAFIRNNCQVKETAEELIIHRNTLMYRLNKIKELTQHNPFVFEGACSLLYEVILHAENEH